MHAIPVVIPLSRTASLTSSVMSLTESPPAVRSSVSRWKTFTAPYCEASGRLRQGNRQYPGPPSVVVPSVVVSSSSVVVPPPAAFPTTIVPLIPSSLWLPIGQYIS